MQNQATSSSEQPRENGHGSRDAAGAGSRSEDPIQEADVEDVPVAVADPTIPPDDGRCSLLEMPGEILSQISSYLPLNAVVPFLSLHPLLLSLTQSNLSPLPPMIRSILSTPPYPHVLAVLPHLPHFIPPDIHDARRLFIQILVRARPKWILERFEGQRWDDAFWKEAFETRFMRSWTRLKADDDTWRAVFLRTLGRIEHRQAGCTHEEAWTRFVTLHRNGSASINRMYSRTFDPYEIYDELKHQNNFSNHPTTVRVLVHLQDVRILAVGVLIDQPSLFVNSNAHLTLHPPLLRHISQPPVDIDTAGGRWFRPVHGNEGGHDSAKSKGRGPSASPGASSNEAYFPLVTSMSPASPQAASYGLTTTGGTAPIPINATSSSRLGSLSGSFGSSPTQSPTGGSLRTTLASYIPRPGRRRTSSLAQDQLPTSSSTGGLGSVLTLVRSRDSDDGRRRTWSLGRARSGSTGLAAVAGSSADATSQTVTNDNGSAAAQQGLDPPPGQGLSPLEEVSPSDNEFDPIYQMRREGSRNKLNDRPYGVLEKPQPALSHARYPNFTPFESSVHSSATSRSSEHNQSQYQAQGAQHNAHPNANGSRSSNGVDPEGATSDLRAQHPEVEDEYEGGLWGGDVSWGAGGMRMAEWHEESGKRRRWVGPMILVAQLHPSTRQTPHPGGVEPHKPLEGPNPDLGPRGMYASLGFEDVETLFPWVELKGSGAWNGESKRSGLGF